MARGCLEEVCYKLPKDLVMTFYVCTEGSIGTQDQAVEAATRGVVSSRGCVYG